MGFEMFRQTRHEVWYLQEWPKRTVSVSSNGDVNVSNTYLVLDMKEVAFAAEFMTVIHHGNRGHLCIGRFTQERGAASSFHKVVETLETVLRARGMLVNDERKSRMMVKTLRSAK